MSLDVIDPLILKRLKAVGGFCIVPTAYADNIRYTLISDHTKIGLIDLPVGYVAAVKLVK